MSRQQAGAMEVATVLANVTGSVEELQAVLVAIALRWFGATDQLHAVQAGHGGLHAPTRPHVPSPGYTSSGALQPSELDVARRCQLVLTHEDDGTTVVAITEPRQGIDWLAKAQAEHVVRLEAPRGPFLSSDTIAQLTCQGCDWTETRLVRLIAEEAPGPMRTADDLKAAVTTWADKRATSHHEAYAIELRRQEA